MSAATTATKITSVIKASASLLVVSPCNSILLMLRPKRGNFPQTHVFPGGKLDDSDPSLAYCALRETYEETGLLIAPPDASSSFVPVVHERDKYPGYREAVTALTGNDPLKLDWSASGGLLKFSEWTTPTSMKQKSRFVTQFFVYYSPKRFDLSHVAANGEVDQIEWLTAAQTLADFKSGRVALMPPQFYLLTAINERGVKSAVESINERKFQPFLKKKFDDGRIELDWGKGESGILTYDKQGIVRDIEYVRGSSASL